MGEEIERWGAAGDLVLLLGAGIECSLWLVSMFCIIVETKIMPLISMKFEMRWKIRSTIRYLGVKGWIGVVGSRRILGLDGRDSIVSSISNASVSIEERCWCWRSRRCLLLEDGVKRANESACRTVACDSFQIPSLWSLVTSFVNESLDANGDVSMPVILVPGPKSSGQKLLWRSGRVGDT